MTTKRLIGRAFLWVISGMLICAVIISCIQNASTFSTGQIASSVGLRQQSQPNKLKGVKVLVFDVHMEGNLGDEMETTPFLQHLHDRGANVTVALSNWLKGKQRLHYRTSREHHYVDEIAAYEWNHFEPRDYAAVVVARKSAPGLGNDF